MGSVIPLYPGKSLTNCIPDAKLDLCPRGDLGMVIRACSQRCSPVGGQAEQGPVGRVSSSLDTAQISERETLPDVGEKTRVLFRLCVQCLLRLCV